jgi:glycosyltransferase involved in cell wall biosynthesis
MKVLHLYSNYKWTGPAELAVSLALGLKRLDAEVVFAAGRDSKGKSLVAERCAGKGLKCLGGLKLGKHRRLLSDRSDSARLAEIIDREEFDVVHSHLDNDHRIALRALKKAKHKPKLVRSVYGGAPPVRLPGGADAVIVISKSVGRWLTEQRRPEPLSVFLADGAVDTDRFAPRPKDRATASAFGIRPNDIVVGIVARMQGHRRFDVLLEAFARAAISEPGLKLLVIGRGTHADKVARRPARELRIADRVIFAGYRSDDYVSVANCIDFKVFLVPGSDGSCRAVRECMSLGKPVIAADRGMLAEIVDHEKNGLVINDTVENLRAAILRLAADRRLRTRLGRAAAEKAEKFFNLKRQASDVMAIYLNLLRRKRRAEKT